MKDEEKEENWVVREYSEREYSEEVRATLRAVLLIAVVAFIFITVMAAIARADACAQPLALPDVPTVADQEVFDFCLNEREQYCVGHSECERLFNEKVWAEIAEEVTFDGELLNLQNELKKERHRRKQCQDRQRR